MSFKEWLLNEMNARQSKKIYKQWLTMDQNKIPWKKKTLNKAIDNWMYKRFKKKGQTSDQAW